MARLDAVYPVSDPGKTTLRYQVYFDALRDLSVFELKTAVDQWLRSEERFSPSPGQLLAIARPAWLRDRPTPKRLQIEHDSGPVQPAPTPERIRQVYSETGFNPHLQDAKTEPAELQPYTEEEMELHRRLAPELLAKLDHALRHRRF